MKKVIEQPNYLLFAWATCIIIGLITYLIVNV